MERSNKLGAAELRSLFLIAIFVVVVCLREKNLFLALSVSRTQVRRELDFLCLPIEKIQNSKYNELNRESVIREKRTNFFGLPQGHLASI